MSLTVKEEELIALRTDKIVTDVTGRLLATHIKNCPHHQAYLVSKARMIGLAIGIVIASGVSSGTIVTILMKIMGT